MSGAESFSSRWAKRKQAVAAQEIEDEPPEVVEEDIAPEPEKTDEEILAELNLIDPDDMKEGDDFSAFMDSAIPQRLRNRALRKLWLSNPALANVDMLVDYGDDFTDAGSIVEDIVTAYKVGKGYLTELAEEDEEGVEAPELSDESDSKASEVESKPADSAPVSSVRKPDPIRVSEQIPKDAKAVEVTEVVTNATPQRRKRMNYRF